MDASRSSCGASRGPDTLGLLVEGRWHQVVIQQLTPLEERQDLQVQDNFKSLRSAVVSDILGLRSLQARLKMLQAALVERAE